MGERVHGPFSCLEESEGMVEEGEGDGERNGREETGNKI